MKCPICGQELTPGKKDPNYLLCYNCKKKFKVPQKKTAEKEDDEEQEEQKYSNIPPKNVRKKREAEMRKAYDEMLAVGDGKGKKKKTKTTKRREEIEDDYDDDYDDDYEDDYEDDYNDEEDDDDDYGYDDEEKMSKIPLIILGIAIVIVAALIICVLLK